MKYGIIGTGWIAESFIEGVRRKTGSEIAAVYSRTEQKGNQFAEKNLIPSVFTGLDEFLAADFDCVYIASPNLLHYEQSVRCLKAGKNVICEKPVTVIPAQYLDCRRLADEKGLVYLEAIMYMHTPHRKILREALNEIGTITSAHFDFSQLSSKYPSFLRGENPNIFNPSLATGCLMDLGVYCVYPAVDLFGVPDNISADAVFLSSGADGSGNASLNYTDKIVTLTYSKTGQDYVGSSIFGDNGTINIESISKLINGRIFDSSGNSRVIIPDIEKPDIMGYEALDFEKYIAGENLDEYREAGDTSFKVSQIMETIRQKANIRFTAD